ncbi:hypothetical protein PN498_26830 [Oscillatoria sp. CS-180]|uniref:hypothetical protein n=1 Tax=Oscillatoria sp. CS-180 TaxID=3021720 RepID=UPI00232BCDB3|nr:hypothetical protein [Oscillatoria sp. CS-180]MDB9529635.1 hypothetical protein [Oscillatoria sp. CS-180]
MALCPIIIFETDYEMTEETLAKPLGTRIAVRNTRTAHLTQQGIPFSQQTLFRATDGARVFVLTSVEPEAKTSTLRTSTKKPLRSASVSPQAPKRARHYRITYR